MQSLQAQLLQTVFTKDVINSEALVDFKYIPKPLSKRLGSFGSVTTVDGVIPLPNTIDRFHLVELGANNFENLDLTIPNKFWLSFADCINFYDLWPSIIQNGVLLDHRNAYIRLEENNILIAFTNAAFLNFDFAYASPVLVRIYKNKYAAVGELSYSSFTLTNTNSNDFLAFRAVINGLTTKTVFINGKLFFYLPTLNSVVPGDLIEVVTDTTFLTTVKQDLTICPVYQSTTYNEARLIFSTDALPQYDNGVDFDAYLTDVTGRGVQLTKVTGKEVTWLTSTDYSISSNTIKNLAAVNNFIPVSVVIIFRNTFITPLICPDFNFANGLDEFVSADRLNFLTGVNANFSLWQASNLDNTALQRLSLKNYYQLVLDDINQVLNRTAINKLLSYDVTSSTTVLTKGCDKLVINASLSSPFEIKGVLDGLPADYNAVLLNSEKQNIPYLRIEIGDTAPVSIRYPADVRVYCLEGANLRQCVFNIEYQLVDTTDNLGNVTTTLNWLADAPIDRFRFIVTSDNYYCYTTSLTEEQLFSGFDIYNGTNPEAELVFSDISFWLNGCYLTYGIDYVVYEGIVRLLSTNFVIGINTVVFLYCGLVDGELVYKDKNLNGIITNGMLAENLQYDLIYDNVARVFVNGAEVDIEGLKFEEAYKDNKGLGDTTLNGKPYCIKRYIELVRSDILDTLSRTKESELRLRSDLEAFMTAVKPIPQPPGFNIVQNRYEIVSPLINAIVTAMAEGRFITLTDVNYDSNTVFQLANDFLFLKHIEPLFNKVDTQLMRVIPTYRRDFTCTLAEYNFLDAVNHFVLDGYVEQFNLIGISG